MLPKKPARDQAITKEQFQRLLECANAPHLKLFLHLAIATAARKSAILELTWLNVKWDEDLLYLGQKPNGKKRATVPLTARLRAELEIAYEASESGWIIEYDGDRVADVKGAFNRACVKAGLEDFTMHDLRHTAAVWMCGKNVRMEKISTYLGHTNVNITYSTYAKYQPDHLRDAADALEI